MTATLVEQGARCWDEEDATSMSPELGLSDLDSTPPTCVRDARNGMSDLPHFDAPFVVHAV